MKLLAEGVKHLPNNLQILDLNFYDNYLGEYGENSMKSL